LEENTTDKLKSRLAQWETYVGKTADKGAKPGAAKVNSEAQEVRSAPAAETANVPPVVPQGPQASPRQSWSAETQRVAHSFTAANTSDESIPIPGGESVANRSFAHLDEGFTSERASGLFGHQTSAHRPVGNQRSRIKVDVSPQRRRDLLAAMWMCAAILVLVLSILLTNQYRG